MKKLVALLLASILVLFGCSNSEEAAGDGVLTVWGFFDGAPKAAVEYYGEQTGTPVEYVTIGWDDYQTKLNTVLGTPEAPDMVLLEKSFMGSYLPTDNFLYIEDIMAGEESMTYYNENTDIATAGPGQIDGKTKAIGWENTASVFFYRSDLAEMCLGISSPEEMEAATQTPADYITMYENLQASDNETCANMALFSWPDWTNGLTIPAGAYVLQEDGSYVITKEFQEALETIKTINESGMIYSPNADKTQITAGNQQDAFLGSVSPAWGTQVALEYEQPGQWAVAQTPLKFTAGGSYFAVTTNADQDLVKEFLNMTFMNKEWMMDNMEYFGMVGNAAMMEEYMATHDTADPYYGGQNVIAEFSEANAAITTYDPITMYDAGISNAVKTCVTSYAVDGTVATVDEAVANMVTELNSVYPDLEVVIEE